MSEPSPPTPQLPAPLVVAATTRRGRWGLIWLLPVAAVLMALGMAVHSWMNTGPHISIRFASANGLESGKSKVRYKEVEVGLVQSVELDEDGDGVVAQVQLHRSAARLANSGTRFWIVRPQLGVAGVSGLNTLISGAYIGVDAGVYDNNRQTEFVGLEQPPAITRDSKGTRYVLSASNLGSLGVGSPLYYRRMAVGRVTSFALDEAGKHVMLEVFVEQPYDRFVTAQTRFWNASGFDMALGPEGLQINTQSLASIVAGGIAFGALSGQPDGADSLPQAAADTHFRLHSSRRLAMSRRSEAALPVRLRYDQPVEGLAVGAVLELHGSAFGEVTATVLDFDPERQRFFTWVDANLYPRQLGPAFERVTQRSGRGQAASDAAQHDERSFVRQLIQHGYRAQLQADNLLTGQMHISFRRPSKGAAAASAWTADWQATPLLLPTASSHTAQLQDQIAHIASQLEKIRFDKIGTELQGGLQSTRRAMDAASHLMTTLAPQAQAMLHDAQRALQSADATMQTLQQTLGQSGGLPDQAGEAMQEVKRAARSLRTLADYLHAHPDALLRGRGHAPASTASSSQP